MIRFCLIVWLCCHVLTSWAIKPMAAWVNTPDSLGLSYRSLTLTTSDQVHLAAWFIEPVAIMPAQQTTMVLAANDYGNMSYQLYQARAMAKVGYRVLLFDYRGFGHSEPFTIDPKRLYYEEFTTDLRAAFAEARRQQPTDKVGILSYSMGTILATKVAATTRCDFLITDSYIAHPQALAALYQAKQKTVLLPPQAASYERVATHVKCPWLLIGGTQDERTPIADSFAITQAARRRERRVVLQVPCDHLGAIEVLSSKGEFGDKYAQAVQCFLTGKSVNADS
jgi:pimeloyl-ACP methyl ester carboxylesterase